MTEAHDPRVSIQGQGNDALVLVPGINGSGNLFYRQVPLLERMYRVATYSLRDEADELDVLVEDLARVVDRAAPIEHRAIVVGESFGGAVALSFALKYPERVSALVILNSFPRFSQQVRLNLAIAGLTVVPRNTMPLARRATAWRLHSPQTPRSEIKRFLSLTAETLHEGYLNRLRLLRKYDVRDRLHELTMPTLFLAADRDHLVPSVREAQYMATRVPTSSLQILTGHGHICLIAPDLDLAKIIEAWSRACPGFPPAPPESYSL
jgi:pimeloyl-ACP methyl ester carboxylesterase